MFNPDSVFVIDSDTNYGKIRIKEAINSTINNSINKHDNIDSAWNNILYKEKTIIKDNIKFKKKLNSLRKTI